LALGHRGWYRERIVSNRRNYRPWSSEIPARSGRTLLVGALAALGVVGAAIPMHSALADPVRQLPARFSRSPYSLMSLSVGAPNDGWQVRARQLRSGSALHLRSGAERHAFAHPALVFMLERSAGELSRSFPGSVLLVGDLSAEQGGPLDGHRSHQSGRDADVAFFMLDWRGRPHRAEHFVAFGGDGRALHERGVVFDDARNFALVAAWLRDSRARVTNVFVSRPLRQRLLAYGARHAEHSVVNQMAALFSQPAGVSAHDDHFHVRIACPERQQAVCDELPH
jgi:penicillin-insensitive murein endopeptidase